MSSPPRPLPTPPLVCIERHDRGGCPRASGSRCLGTRLHPSAAAARWSKMMASSRYIGRRRGKGYLGVGIRRKFGGSPPSKEQRRAAAAATSRRNTLNVMSTRQERSGSSTAFLQQCLAAGADRGFVWGDRSALASIHSADYRGFEPYIALAQDARCFASVAGIPTEYAGIPVLKAPRPPNNTDNPTMNLHEYQSKRLFAEVRHPGAARHPGRDRRRCGCGSRRAGR